MTPEIEKEHEEFWTKEFKKMAPKKLLKRCANELEMLKSGKFTSVEHKLEIQQRVKLAEKAIRERGLR